MALPSNPVAVSEACLEPWVEECKVNYKIYSTNERQILHGFIGYNFYLRILCKAKFMSKTFLLKEM